MKISIKSAAELSKMRQAGQILAQVFSEIEKLMRPGVSGLEIEKLAKKKIKQAGGRPAFLGYQKYPFATCVSVNQGLVHNLPTRRQFHSGDMVGIDIGVCFQGFCADKATTFPIGQVSPQAQKIIRAGRAALAAGIRVAGPGRHLGDIQQAIQQKIETAGFWTIRDLAGHGIGQKIHEPPTIYNFGKPGTGLLLEPGMTLALEPMLGETTDKIKTLKNGWGVVMADQGLGCHFEETIVITSQGAAILTR